MDGNAIPIGENTKVIVRVSGDLFLQGGDQAEVRFLSSEDRIRVNHSNDTIYVETHGNLDITVPRGVPVMIEKVGGSAFISDLMAPVTVQKIGGDLAMRRLVNLVIEKVGGTCWVEDINGAVEINKVGGDLSMRQVGGPVMINTIGGEGNLQVAANGPLSARAGGDLHVYFIEHIAGPVSLRSGGEVELFFPGEIAASLSLTSDGETIEFSGMEQEQTIHSRHYNWNLGEGGQPVEARAGGDIRIHLEGEEPEPITEELDRRENAWLEARERHGHPAWTGGFGFDRSSAWADMISRRAQEAARRAEHRAHAAMRRTEEQIRLAAEREIRRSSGSRWSGVPTAPPPPPAPDPVSEQERLLVLQMLQEQKITVEQAEKLLAALEGRFDR